MTSSGRALRAAATGAVLAALLAGTIWGQDDHFPFGPFRMYSTTTTDRVTVVRFTATTVTGEELLLRSADFGLRPAEVQGQVERVVADPALLGAFAAAYADFHPDSPPLERLALVFGTHYLGGGRRTRYDEEVLASWTRR